jgi:hypothetical protein
VRGEVLETGRESKVTHPEGRRLHPGLHERGGRRLRHRGARAG